MFEFLATSGPVAAMPHARVFVLRAGKAVFDRVVEYHNYSRLGDVLYECTGGSYAEPAMEHLEGFLSGCACPQCSAAVAIAPAFTAPASNAWQPTSSDLRAEVLADMGCKFIKFELGASQAAGEAAAAAGDGPPAPVTVVERLMNPAATSLPPKRTTQLELGSTALYNTMLDWLAECGAGWVPALAQAAGTYAAGEPQHKLACSMWSAYATRLDSRFLQLDWTALNRTGACAAHAVQAAV